MALSYEQAALWPESSKDHKALLLEAARLLREQGNLEHAVAIEAVIEILEEACMRIIAFEKLLHAAKH